MLQRAVSAGPSTKCIWMGRVFIFHLLHPQRQQHPHHLLLMLVQSNQVMTTQVSFIKAKTIKWSYFTLMQQRSESGPKEESSGTGHVMLCLDFVPRCTKSIAIALKKLITPERVETPLATPSSFLTLSTAAEDKATITIHIQSSP